jgi:succinoglycan biosynthesis protein ExoA
MSSTSTSAPFVSVVIPMRNEEASIAACIDAVLAQDYPSDRIEVIVVDGDSSDGSAAIVEELGRRTGGRVRLLFNPDRIVPPGLNLAIREARGEIIARVDGHTRIAPDYVREGVEALRRTGAENVGGAMTAIGGGVLGDAVARVTSSRFGVGSYFHYGTEERPVDTVYLGMWPRAVFGRIGLFDEELVRNQDDELNYRLRKAGGRVMLVPSMRSLYQNRQSLRHLARQYYQYGLYKVRVLQKHPRQMSWRHFVPPLFVLGLALMIVAAPLSASVAVAAAATAAAYLAVTAALALNLSGADGVRPWLAAWLAFIIIHFCWGGGFLAGLARFANRWGMEEPAPPALAAGATGRGSSGQFSETGG